MFFGPHKCKLHAPQQETLQKSALGEAWPGPAPLGALHPCVSAGLEQGLSSPRFWVQEQMFRLDMRTKSEISHHSTKHKAEEHTCCAPRMMTIQPAVHREACNIQHIQPYNSSHG